MTRRLALLLLFACAPAAVPPPAVQRLVDLLPWAQELPLPRVEQPWFRLTATPSDEPAAAYVVPVPPGAAVLARAFLLAGGARVEMRALSAAELQSLGPGKHAAADIPAGIDLGACETAATAFPAACAREVELGYRRAAVALLPHGQVAELELRAAHLADVRLPANPVTSRLVERTTRTTPSGESTRDSLIAPAGSRYRFRLRVPAEAHLRVGLGYQHGAGPLRFRVWQDGTLVSDSAPAVGETWVEVDAPLRESTSSASELTLETSDADGAPPTADRPAGLWANPTIGTATDRPNILLVTIDALRADHLECDGYARETAPTLCALAREGTLFAQAFAQGPSTWISVSSFLSGRYPLRAGVIDRGERLPADLPTLPDMLRAAGYSTFAGSSLAAFPPSYLSYFDDVEAHDDRRGQIEAQASHVADLMRRQPTFAWFHLEDSHYPLEPTIPDRFDPGYDGGFRDGFSMADLNRFAREDQVTAAEQAHITALYDSALRDADDALRKLVAAIDAAGLAQRTLIVVSADHGTLLGEHGIVINHGFPYASVIHVPLVLAWPGHLEPRPPSDARVQLVDVAPTVLDLAGLAAPPGLDGRSLVPALMGRHLPPVRPFAEVNAIYSLIDYPFHVIANPTLGKWERTWGAGDEELKREYVYNVQTDPDERNDLTASQPELAAKLYDEVRLEVGRQKGESRVEASHEVGSTLIDALRSAGYLPAGSSP